MDSVTLKKHISDSFRKHGEAIGSVLSEFGYDGKLTVGALLAVYHEHGSEFTKALDEETDPSIGFEKLLIEAKQVSENKPAEETESFIGKKGEGKKTPLLVKLGIASVIVFGIIYLLRK